MGRPEVPELVSLSVSAWSLKVRDLTLANRRQARGGAENLEQPCWRQGYLVDSGRICIT